MWKKHLTKHISGVTPSHPVPAAENRSSTTTMRRAPPNRNAQTRRLLVEQLEERRVMTVDAQLISDIGPASVGSDPQDFTDVGGVTFFSATTPAAGRELWRTDGTAAGTKLVADIRFGVEGSSPG